MTAPAAHFVHPSTRSLRVLLADDNRDSTDSLAELLMMVGCDVCKCYDGGEALQSADEFRPDVCILDLWMPIVNGWNVAKRLRTWADGRAILLIALTGVGGRQSTENSLAAGFDHHILKPSDPEEIFLVPIRQVAHRQAGLLQRTGEAVVEAMVPTAVHLHQHQVKEVVPPV